ncbi:hypothetical protein [Flavobacterium sangjuense]|uniref:Uncharacterized protein n=1 Tax=Flavobacterium sangjuense TaxID=2518177 RepID=A0A4P7PW83_9FLAO|nr:hypothetical protein [Flavobacterium sangjuense]QBZ98660.1 hypothetical protein GS03_02169 [Flavobacterium sangjuense]
MKKIGLCLAMIAFLMISACDKKVEKTTETETIENTTIVQDTVVKEVPVEAEEEGTSVKVSNNGVDVDSKDVDVEIKK